MNYATKPFEVTNKETLSHISAAAKIVEYSKAISELRILIENSSALEGDFQKHLERHPWMFGSEYSQRLQRKTWTRDDRLDFMMRKTVDDYVEIIEIKRAFIESLFTYDRSHDSYYPSSKLSAVIGQVVRYIEEIERQRDSIIVSEGFDTLKIRAKIIVGRDGDAEQIKALRNLNSHLHRIEIITYDQLLKVSERILSMFDVATLPRKEGISEDIPF
ncbi:MULTISPECIES: Shedu anti-phage system protein SduA domain-containing protein [unclassified Vibrio]